MFAKSRFSYMLTALVGSAALLQASDASASEETLPLENHVEIGSREEDPEVKEFTRQIRAIEEANNDAGPNLSETGEFITPTAHRFTPSVSEFRRASPRFEPLCIARVAYPFHVNSHTIKSTSEDSQSIEIEDGSHWEVDPSSASTVTGWRLGEAISITPNYNSWFSYDNPAYEYYITNKNTQTYVKAKLKMGPVQFGLNSNWIISIDAYSGRVVLQNNMQFHVDASERYLLKKWEVNDHIILGNYSSWFSGNNRILINVEMNNHVRARQY
jgi:hypothetical protein